MFENPFRENRLNDSRNFRPDWDVPELNRDVSDWLVSEVHRLRGRQEADPGQMIPILLGPPGYGKTHLFGRIAHRLSNEVFFAFVPALEERRQPLDHILWHVVDALFREADGGVSPAAEALARLSRPAFADYFDGLPGTLAARHAPIRERLRQEPSAVLEIVQAAGTLEPFLKLADSLVHSLPHHAGVVRALALAWAPKPWPLSARRWLRGEDLPDEERAALRLPDEPPGALDVLRAVPALFGFERPFVICCDQMESVLQSNNPAVVNIFTNGLMDVLQAVPVQIVLSCLSDRWEKVIGESFGAFRMRVRQPPFQLADLTESQALRLVTSRMKSVAIDRPEGVDVAWPFVDTEVMQLVREKGPTPRVLIQHCATKFDDWAEGDRRGPITPLDAGGPRPDPEVLFLHEWNRELESIRRDETRSADAQPEERIFKGIVEALKLAKAARREFGGVRVFDVNDRAFPTSQTRRLGARVTIGAGPEETTVIVAVTKLDSSGSLRYFVEALLSVAADPVAGALLIHPKRDLRLGNTTRERVDAALKARKLSSLPLEDHAPTYAALECLVKLLDRAYSSELVLGGKTIAVEECRDLVLKTAVLDGLDLFKMLAQWRRPATSVGVAAPLHQPAAIPPAQAHESAVIPAIPAGESPSVSPELPPADLDTWAQGRLDEVVKKLKLWGLPVEPEGYELGPTFARLKARPIGKTTYKAVSNKAVDLRIHLDLQVVPIVGSQAGYISIDVQRPNRGTVTLAQALSDAPAGVAGEPAFPVGKDVAGITHWLNLADPADCHVLVAGTTGSGKSEFLRAAIAALADRLPPEQLQLVLVDPKRVTFNLAGVSSPYLRNPVARDVDETLPLVKSCLEETERRYEMLEKQKLTNISSLSPALLPRIVIVIDEFATLLEDKEAKKALNALLKRIGATARAAGVHLILATQRPEGSVVTPILRDNLPGRIALKVAAKAGSELILGSPEAEYLLGKGDLLWKRGGGLLRLQSPFVTQEEFERKLRVQ